MFRLPTDFRLLPVCFLLFAATSVSAQQPTESQPAEKLVETQHEAQIAGQSIPFTATAGRLMLRSDEGKPRAGMFFVAYTRGSQPSTDRPIT
ncbi:MAG: hypothetical protein RL215_269, partial [Planctomycetota bacterium]